MNWNNGSRSDALSKKHSHKTPSPLSAKIEKQKISVIMPVKNTAGYLPECLNSIVRQTEENWELLAVDDNSEDDSLKILNHHAAKDKRIRVFQNPGVGIIPALDLAFNKSNGNYITRMDSDDIMLDIKLKSLKEHLIKKGRKHLAVGQVSYFSDEKLGAGYKKYAQWLNKLSAKSENFKEIYKECVVPSPCWMIHREDLMACGGVRSETYPEDYDLCFRFYREGYKIAGINKILHKWRDYPSRSSRTQEHYSDNRFLDMKIRYFIDLDLDPNSELIVWGAGKKGKAIAKILIDKIQSFQWISNNPKKINREIYGTYIQAPESIKNYSKSQVIIAVANPNEQKLLIRDLKRLNLELELFKFC
jgi:glycosyltransferase involved in cell wall biosynthesis